jgi:cell wall-associated NlpC family hydrolase
MDPGNTEHHQGAVTGEDVARTARILIGTKYLHQGRSIHGIDCVGVPIWVCTELGILPDEVRRANYGRIATGELLQELQRFCVRLEVPEIGCLIAFKWPGESTAGHVAIKTPYGIVHAYRNHGGVKEHGYRAKWPEWTDSFWRLPGVSGG